MLGPQRDPPAALPRQQLTNGFYYTACLHQSELDSPPVEELELRCRYGTEPLLLHAAMLSIHKQPLFYRTPYHPAAILQRCRRLRVTRPCTNESSAAPVVFVFGL